MTLTLVVDNPKAVALALTYPDRARSLCIEDAVSYAQACEFLKGIKALRAEIAETFEPHIKRAHESHRALLKEKADAEVPLAEAERIAKAALVVYDQQQDCIRRAEQERVRAELKRQEEERLLAEALDAEAAGDVETADALISEPVHVPTVAVAPSTPKVSGISYRETWSAEVTDLAALVRYVAQHPLFAGLLSPNMPALNGQARSLKGQLQIPGVKAVCTRDVAAGRR